MRVASINQGQLARALKLLLVVGSLYFVGAFVVIALLRLNYPFELEWIEGAMVDSARWILGGHNLYGRPSLDFLALAYHPMYFLLSAELMKVLGVGFVAPRLISFASALGSFAVIFLLVRRETGLAIAGVVAAGLFAATYHVAGAWLDLARVDALFLFLMLLAAYVARAVSGARGAALSALTLVLAYATKQPALLLVICLTGYYLFEDRRAAAVFGLSALGTGLAFHVFWDVSSGGWFEFYTRDILRQHALVTEYVYRFWSQDLANVPIMAAFATAFLLRPSDAGRSRWRFYCALTVGLIAISWAGRINSGGALNVILPAMAALTVLSGLTLASALKTGIAHFSVLALALCSVQLVLLRYDPSAYLPTPDDRAAGERMLQIVHSLPGDVYIPLHSFYAAQAEKPTHAHWSAIADVGGLWYTNRAAVRGSDTEERRAIILTELAHAVSTGKFNAIILSEPANDSSHYLPNLILANYEQQGTIFSDEDSSVFWPRSGFKVRPQYVYIRKRQTAG